MKRPDALRVVTTLLLFGLPLATAFGVLTFIATGEGFAPLLLSGMSVLMWLRLLSNHLKLAVQEAVREYQEKRLEDVTPPEKPCLLCKGTGVRTCRQCHGTREQPYIRKPNGLVFATAVHKACGGAGCDHCYDGLISGVLLPGETADVFELGDKLNEGSAIEQEHMDREKEREDGEE